MNEVCRDSKFKWQYLFATILDMIIFYLFILICSLVVASVFLDQKELSENIKIPIFFICLGLFWYGYFLFFLKKLNGTIAMKIFNFKIVSYDKKGLSHFSIFIWAFILPNPWLCFLSFFMVLFKPERTLIEQWSKTIVIAKGVEA